MSVARFALLTTLFIGLDHCTRVLCSTVSLNRRTGALEGVQTVSDPALAWRAFACMASFNASDNTPLLMLYGGTAQANTKDPLAVAANGVTSLQVFDFKSSKWYAPTTANAPKTGPVLPACGAASGNIWVYNSQYGVPNKASTAVSLLDSVHWSWSSPTQQGQLPVTRFGAASAFADSTQSFYLHGGIPLSDDTNTASNPPGIANNMDILLPSGLAWNYASNGPARKYHTLCYMSSIDSLVLFGGSDQNIASYNDVKTFSTKENIWQYSVTVQGAAPAERILHSAVCTADSMFIFGGVHSIADDPSDSAVWVLKANGPTNFTWSKAPILASSLSIGPAARAGHAAALYEGGMYIFGGIGPSGQDGTMYKLDLNKWTWSKTAATQPDSTGGTGGANTRVLIAAVVSSVLAVILIGIIAMVFYRWNRRRAAMAASTALDSRQSSGSGTPGDLKCAGDTLQRDDALFGYIGGSGSTAVYCSKANRIVANNYMPSPHANLSLGSSVGNFSLPSGPPVMLESASYSDSGLAGSPSATPPSRGDSAALSSPLSAHRLTCSSPSEMISNILVSGQPIPAWLREAAKRSPGEQGGSSPADLSTLQTPVRSAGLTSTLVVANTMGKADPAGRYRVGDPASPMEDASGQCGFNNFPAESKHQGASSVATLEPDNHAPRPLDRSSIYSDATNDTQSAVACEPVKYMVDSSQMTMHQAGGLGVSGASRKKTRRQTSDLSDIDFVYELRDTEFLGWPGEGSIAQPMLPPVPPHMNSLYGALGSAGIIVGRAGISAGSLAAGGHVATVSTVEPDLPSTAVPASLSADHSADDNVILSPLDRLARFHNMDSWMAFQQERARSPSQASASAATDDTSNIYNALPAQRSVDSL